MTAGLPEPLPPHLAVLNWLRLDSGLRQQQIYVGELESLRGLAFFLVFLFHCWGMSGLHYGEDTPIPMAYFASGNSGVTLFFVLSGFLLSLPWIRHHLNGDHRPSIRNYYLSRALRILPMYYAVLIFTLLTHGHPAVLAKASVFGFVGFEAFPFSVVWWTLSTEVQFYIALPLLMSLWCGNRYSRWFLLALLAAWGAGYYLIVIRHQFIDIANSFLFTKSLLARLPAFLLGAVAAAILVYSRGRNPHAGNPQYRPLALGCLLACQVALIAVLAKTALLGDRTAEIHWHIHHSYEAALWAASLLILVSCDFPGKSLLANTTFSVLGKLSYSLYLVHVPVLFYLIYPVRARLGDQAYIESPWLYLLPLAGLSVCVALSACTYRWIELPFLNLKHRLSL